ncbi:MAG: histidine phosphatase family protein [Chloroflexi bacterium]|nr:histidine phosphatase family protein [Chloroflexota bacterium]
MVKRVIFIRPGETDWNRLGRWQGWVAVPLNDLGRRQARKLAQFIRNIGLSALYSSDLRRAVETAEILSEQLGFAPVYDSRLRERNIGAWQGLTLDEIRAWYPDDYARLLESPDDFEVPGGESFLQVQQRAMETFDEILAQDRGVTIGIISHTTAIHALLNELIAGCCANEVAVSNMSVTTIARDDEWRLVAVDDVSHLEGLETQHYPELEDN